MILKFVIVSNRHFYAFLYISTLRLLGLFIFLRNGGYVNARKDLEKKNDAAVTFDSETKELVP